MCQSERHILKYLRDIPKTSERHLSDVLGMSLMSCVCVSDTSLRCLGYVSQMSGVYVSQILEYASLRLIAGNPSPRGGFLFSMFPNPEPGERGRLSKHLVHILGGGFLSIKMSCVCAFYSLVYVSLWCLVACRCLWIVCVCLCLSTLYVVCFWMMSLRCLCDYI